MEEKIKELEKRVAELEKHIQEQPKVINNCIIYDSNSSTCKKD
ncbi:hypothetical protein [Clostridium tetani]|nr:hypothetical protein [Clostridium tetani]